MANTPSNNNATTTNRTPPPRRRNKAKDPSHTQGFYPQVSQPQPTWPIITILSDVPHSRISKQSKTKPTPNSLQ